MTMLKIQSITKSKGKEADDGMVRNWLSHFSHLNVTSLVHGTTQNQADVAHIRRFLSRSGSHTHTHTLLIYLSLSISLPTGKSRYNQRRHSLRKTAVEADNLMT